ncbi:unnamed protein product [Sympodiomycopsis kandeliae]
MKNTLLDANFPLDANQATYHVATRPGQVANRLITVGDQTRARRIAKHFDGGKPIFELESQRNFLTLTGTYKGVPISVVAIGMGHSAVDFFMRECRAVIVGEMIVVRFGSCGSIAREVPIGTVVVPFRSHGITRQYDYFHPETTAEERASGKIEPYHITKPMNCDQDVHDALCKALNDTAPTPQDNCFDGKTPTSIGQVVNGSADAFYGSQGRLGSTFLDSNENLVDTFAERHGIQTLEMETFVINHLAYCANLAAQYNKDKSNGQATENASVNPNRIRTGAVQMIFANRHTSAFITPQEVHLLEDWAGKAVCEALAAMDIDQNHLHPQGVWQQK